MSKSVVVDRVKVIAEMARQNLTTEELSLKAGVGRNAVWKMRKGQPVWRTTAGHVAAALGVTVDDLKEGYGSCGVNVLRGCGGLLAHLRFLGLRRCAA